MNKNVQQTTVNSSRRNWLKSVGLGAGAVALTTSVDSIMGELHAAGMPTEHFPSATPNVNDGLIRLSSNENAFGPSKKAAKAMQSELLNLARYTDATVEVLAQKIAKQEGVSADQIIITKYNGDTYINKYIYIPAAWRSREPPPQRVRRRSGSGRAPRAS